MDKSSGVGRAASAATRKKKKGYCDPVSAIISLQITGQAPTPSSPKPVRPTRLSGLRDRIGT